jgi:hypothetical protein
MRAWDDVNTGQLDLSILKQIQRHSVGEYLPRCVPNPHSILLSDIWSSSLDDGARNVPLKRPNCQGIQDQGNVGSHKLENLIFSSMNLVILVLSLDTMPYLFRFHIAVVERHKYQRMGKKDICIRCNMCNMSRTL